MEGMNQPGIVASRALPKSALEFLHFGIDPDIMLLENPAPKARRYTSPARSAGKRRMRQMGGLKARSIDV
jgi:hypothetical protein